MSGKYQTYPEYKDSGVRWLGSIPANWQVKRVKHLTTLNPSKSEVRSRSKDEHVSFIPMEAIGEQGELDASGSRLLGEVLSGYTYVADGDVMLAKITPCFENGKAAVATGLQQGIGFATTEVIPVRPNDPEDAKFFYYLLTSMPFKAVAEGSMYGAGGQKRVADSFVAEYHLAAPPSLERTQIAAFLDHETARIDRLIEKQQRLIELLKEKRQAVISHAVTKGLDPNVPMKDSGVEWLGQVPAHWVIRRLKHIAQLQSGIPKGKDLSGKQTISVPMLRVANVQDGYVKLDDVHQIEIEPHELMRYTLQSGDVLMNEGGDNDKLGRGAVWHGQLEPCIHQNHVFAIRVSDIEPEWLSLVTGSKYAKYHFYCVAKQSTNLASISSSNIKETPLVIPPKIERQQIMKYLVNMTSKLDQVSEFASRQIALLQERRTALISAAVTGKIDVRNWQLNTSTQAAESDLPMAAEQAAEYRV